MRKISAILLIFAAIVALCSCASDEIEFVSPVKFYYQRRELTYGTDDGVISFEMFEANGHREDHRYLLEQYLNGPSSDELVQVIPRNTAVTGFRLEDGEAYLELSGNFAALEGIDLTIACACLTKTVSAMTGADTLHISAGGEPLDGGTVITMNIADVLLADVSTEPTS